MREREGMWELGEREERRWGGGGGNGGGSCILAVARERKHVAAKSVAIARFPVMRYC